VTQQRPTPAERAHLLAVPIQRGTTLLGLMLLDSPWASGHVPGEQLALIQAIAKLGALLIERARLLHEREAARAEVLSLSAAKRNLEHFLGIASHELRTPLTSMLLGLELGRRSLDREIAQQQDHATGASKSPLEVTQQRLGLVFAQSKRLEFLVEELLENSLIEANQFCLHQKACDLVALTCQAVEEQRSLAPDRVIALHLSAEQPIPIFADAERMRQVLNSYLTNALKFSAEACPVDVGIAMDGQQAQVWVQDAGPGIHKDAHALVWERFSRVPGVEVLSGSGVGLGLGLYISRAIIERHQGQVGLQSAPGRGARFWFRVPLLSSPT
jgi:signal transduction histidine kinase